MIFKKQEVIKPFSYELKNFSSDQLLSLDKDSFYSLIEKKVFEKNNLKIKINSLNTKMNIIYSMFNDQCDEIYLLVNIEDYEYL